MVRCTRSSSKLALFAFALVAAFCVVASLTACAGRRPVEEPPPVTRATPTPTVAPTPVPTPTPMPVPPAIACASDADCTLTPYRRMVTSAAGCYCPTCPEPRNTGVAAANEEAWRRLCGDAWSERVRCKAPMCARPIAPACVDGACQPAAVSEAGAPPG
jgi:hypothetical protein